MNFVLENQQLKVTVASHGAEVKSVVRKADGREMMWQADPAFWGRTSPVLFPVVGCYYEKKSIFGGKTYEMGQHGFARDMEFACLREDASELVFELREDASTLEKYPFAFCLQVRYVLTDGTLAVEWTVENTNAETMYFSIGAHPAFCCDLDREVLYFEKAGASCKEIVANIIAADGSGCLSDDCDRYELEEGKLAMSDALFAKDALVVEGAQADAVSILDGGGKRLVRVTCDTPLFGVWSPVGKHAPFVCIEPWYGRCDRVGFSQKLEEREYGNVLAAGERFVGGYTMQF